MRGVCYVYDFDASTFYFDAGMYIVLQEQTWRYRVHASFLLFVSGLGEAEDALNLIHRFSISKVRGMDYENLRLESNPWIMPPEAVVEEGLTAVVEYLTDVRIAKKAGAEVKELKLLKVVLVGSSRAGKTR